MPAPPAPSRDSCALALLGWRSSPALRDDVFLRGALLRGADLFAEGPAARRGLLPPGAMPVFGVAPTAVAPTGVRRPAPAPRPALLAGRARRALLRGPAAERGPALVPPLPLAWGCPLAKPPVTLNERGAATAGLLTMVPMPKGSDGWPAPALRPPWMVPRRPM